MTAHNPTELKVSIEAKIAELIEDIALRKKSIAPVAPDNAIGRLSRMESMVSQEVSETALASAQRTLKALERALLRVDDDDFGLCRECDRAIPTGRLLAVPESGFCVSCAEKLSG